MAFNCRIFGHPGLRQMHMVNPVQYSADSVWMLAQPYTWGQLLVADAVAVSSIPLTGGANDQVKILRVEVADGQSIRYEINNGSIAPRVANINSPILSGHDQFEFMPGWTLSIINAAGLA